MINKTVFSNINDLEKNLELYIDKLENKELEKIILKKEDVVIIPIEEYERLLSMSEAYENEQIAKIIDERVTNRKTPLKMISHEEMMERLRKRAKNV